MEMSAKKSGYYRNSTFTMAHSLKGRRTADCILNGWCVAESRSRSDWMTVEIYEANVRIYPLYDPPLCITWFWPSHTLRPHSAIFVRYSHPVYNNPAIQAFLTTISIYQPDSENLDRESWSSLLDAIQVPACLNLDESNSPGFIALGYTLGDLKS